MVHTAGDKKVVSKDIFYFGGCELNPNHRVVLVQRNPVVLFSTCVSVYEKKTVCVCVCVSM